jgi:hypothetical protein
MCFQNYKFQGLTPSKWRGVEWGTSIQLGQTENLVFEH